MNVTSLLQVPAGSQTVATSGSAASSTSSLPGFHASLLAAQNDSPDPTDGIIAPASYTGAPTSKAGEKDAATKSPQEASAPTTMPLPVLPQSVTQAGQASLREPEDTDVTGSDADDTSSVSNVGEDQVANPPASAGSPATSMPSEVKEPADVTVAAVTSPINLFLQAKTNISGVVVATLTAAGNRGSKSGATAAIDSVPANKHQPGVTKRNDHSQDTPQPNTDALTSVATSVVAAATAPVLPTVSLASIAPVAAPGDTVAPPDSDSAHLPETAGSLTLPLQNSFAPHLQTILSPVHAPVESEPGAESTATADATQVAPASTGQDENSQPSQTAAPSGTQQNAGQIAAAVQSLVEAKSASGATVANATAPQKHEVAAQPTPAVPPAEQASSSTAVQQPATPNFTQVAPAAVVAPAMPQVLQPVTMSALSQKTNVISGTPKAGATPATRTATQANAVSVDDGSGKASSHVSAASATDADTQSSGQENDQTKTSTSNSSNTSPLVQTTTPPASGAISQPVALIDHAAQASLSSPRQPATNLSSGADHASSAANASAQAAVPQTHQMPEVNSARLIQSVGQSEMKVGLRSSEFGDISIRTSATRDLVSAQISLEHDELAKTLVNHLPELQTKLNGSQPMEVRIEMNGQAAGQSGHQQGTGGNTANSWSGNAQQGPQARGGGRSSAMDSEGIIPTVPVSSAAYSSGSRLDVTA